MLGTVKPRKKTDKELWKLITQKIENVEYLILKHARERQKQRNITDLDILDILENKKKRHRRRNKKKDQYQENFSDWSYCIEGFDLNGEKIRIAISFDEKMMLIITVIRVND